VAFAPAIAVAVSSAASTVSATLSSAAARVAVAGATALDRARVWESRAIQSFTGGASSGARTFGDVVRDFRANPGAWTRISVHAEPALSRQFKGGISMEEVWVSSGGDRIIQHLIYMEDKLVHSTVRSFARFGA
jgi:hypothetical protein